MTHISRQYFGYEPLRGHADDCTRGPGSSWEVARYVEYGFGEQSDEVRSTSFRLYCPECGAVQFLESPGHIERKFESTAAIGYGSAPERVAGLWLWAGPPLLDVKDGPDSYLVTTHKVRPGRPRQVAGLIGQGRRSARFNAAKRWYAALGCTDYGTGMQAGPEDGFKTRAAAVKWLAEQLATRADVDGELDAALGGAS